MSTRNVQKLIKKYSDKARMEHRLLESVSPHTLRRTRGTTLYRDGDDLPAISALLGHPLWPDDENEISRILGLG